MRIGFVGLGKLGLPVAAAIASKGHQVCGTDVNPDVARYIETGQVPYREANLTDITKVEWKPSTGDVVRSSDIVFVAVQTPHDPAYEGVTPAPERRRDFEYGYLAAAYAEVCRHAVGQLVAVISTVLPGTMKRTVLPRGDARTVYNPLFIAMGTVTDDYLNPEFVIVGADDARDGLELQQFYGTLHDRPVVATSIDSAELVKVAYNGVISAKIVLGNWIGEICEKTGADADQVHGALSHATDRLWSPRYFRAGMGDGGGCHPRDNIALSWLAERLDLSVDVGGWVTRSREQHLEWIAQVARDWSTQTRLPILVVGAEYKPETNISTGSPSRLLASILADPRDPPFTCLVHEPRDTPAVYVIGCQHARYTSVEWPQGSVVIDPFGYIPDRPGVTVQRLGRKR